VAAIRLNEERHDPMITGWRNNARSL
jgi:hypothetical protein